MSVECELQGAKAAKSGKNFESVVEQVFKDLLVACATADEREYYMLNPSMAPKSFYSKNITFNLPDGGKGKTEFSLWIKDALETPEFSTNGNNSFTMYRIEAKVQTTSGSAEDKLPTNLRQMSKICGEKRFMMIVFLSGCTEKTVIELINTSKEIVVSDFRGGVEVAVLGVEGLREQIQIATGALPLPNRESYNDRSRRDVEGPEAEERELIKTAYKELVTASRSSVNPEHFLALKPGKPLPRSKKQVMIVDEVQMDMFAAR